MNYLIISQSIQEGKYYILIIKIFPTIEIIKYKTAIPIFCIPMAIKKY